MTFEEKREAAIAWLRTRGTFGRYILDAGSPAPQWVSQIEPSSLKFERVYFNAPGNARRGNAI